jgi:biotin carboxyl carrier protein
MYKHPSTIESVSVDGEVYPLSELNNNIQIHSLEKDGTCTFSFKKRKHVVIIDLENRKDRQSFIKTKGKEFSLKINTSLSLLIEQLGFNESAANTDSEVIAPMPGLVLKTMVKKDEEVVQGQILLTLEAMKMENAIKSPRDGIIKEIKVKDGDKVDKGSILIQF